MSIDSQCNINLIMNGLVCWGDACNTSPQGQNSCICLPHLWSCDCKKTQRWLYCEYNTLSSHLELSTSDFCLWSVHRAWRWPGKSLIQRSNKKNISSHRDVFAGGTKMIWVPLSLVKTVAISTCHFLKGGGWKWAEMRSLSITFKSVRFAWWRLGALHYWFIRSPQALRILGSTGKFRQIWQNGLLFHSFAAAVPATKHPPQRLPELPRSKIVYKRVKATVKAIETQCELVNGIQATLLTPKNHVDSLNDHIGQVADDEAQGCNYHYSLCTLVGPVESCVKCLSKGPSHCVIANN